MNNLIEKLTNDRKTVISVMIITSLFFVAPLMHTHVIFASDDLIYHINRIQELTINLKKGNWYPFLYSYRFHDVPFLLGSFYPQLTLLPFAVFSLITKNYVVGIYLGISLYTFITMLVMYYIGVQLKRSSAEALILALVYSFSACRTYNIFSRFALGEYLGMTFTPLALYGLYAIVKGNKSGWKCLGLGLSFVLLSHVLSTFLCVMVLCIELIILALTIKKVAWRSVFIDLTKSVGLFIASSLIFLVPFLEQMMSYKIAQPSPMNLLEYSPTVAELFNNSISNNLISGYIMGTGLSQGMGIGILYVIAAVWGFAKFKDLDVISRYSLVLGTAILLATSKLFPWSTLMATPIKIIQIPTRLIPFATIYLSVVVAKMLVVFARSSTKKAIAASMIAIVVSVPWLGSIQNFHSQMNGRWDNFYNKRVYTSNNAQKDASFWYLDQYIPQNSSKYLTKITNHIAMINSKNVQLKEISALPNGISYKDAKLNEARNVVLPVVNYKNIEVIQGNKVLPHKDRNGLIFLKRTQNGPLKIQYIPSLLDRFAMIVSIVTWVSFLLLGINEFIKKAR